MTRETGRRQRGDSAAASGGLARRAALRPAVEPLEGRRLLSSFYSGPSATRPVHTAGGVYTLTVNGPGLEKVRQVGHGQIAVTLFGTTPTSTLNVALTRPRLHTTAANLQIASIRVASGQLGGILASGAAVLNGPITPLNGSVNTLQFAELEPNAQIDVKGSLASMSVSGGVDLGPGGHVNIGGDLTQGLTVGALDLAGGRFSIAHNLAGPVSLGSVGLTQGGQFLVGHDLTGRVSVAANLSISGTNSLFSTGHDLVGGLSVGQDFTLDSGGQFAVGNDLSGPVNIGGVLSLSNQARFIVNRDVLGAISVGGDLDLASGGILSVGRDLNAVNALATSVVTADSLIVNGNLNVAPSGGSIAVGGTLNGMLVNGVFVGNGTATPDLTVGQDLNNLTVLGSTPNQGSLQHVSIDVAKSINGLSASHGIFNSLITAGVNINGVTVGPDGVVAVLDSQILAGSTISNVTLNGDLKSDYPTNPTPTGYPTRVVAGETRSGQFSPGGVITGFVVNGMLIDAVLAASVQPFGGDGTLPPPVAYGAPPRAPSTTPGDLGFNTYDAPAGVTGTGSAAYKNYSELSYGPTGVTVTYDRATDPTIDDFIYPGGVINATVTGGVVSTPHDDRFDFAGIFAAQTLGVNGGPLPGS